MPKVKKNIRVEEIDFPPYQELIDLVDTKLGEKPSLPQDLPSGTWTEQSLKVLQERYLFKNEDEESMETPEEMCWRVAWDIASAEVKWGKDKDQIEEQARKFYHLLIEHVFLPNSPTLMNAGTRNGLQYSGCFVVPIEDSLIGIFDALKYQALIHQTGGGTGFSFSRLRPKGSLVKSSKGTASGPVSFMKIFDAATNEIKQGGRRRGANMGILRVDHPDIMEFIHCKEEGGITNFNISVGITNKFIEAFKKDRDYELIDPKTGQNSGTLSAKEVFEEIAQAAWKTGDPGLIFIDRLNESSCNPVPALGPIESTNPCGEQPLYPYDSCNLGSIFLNYLVKNNETKTEFDWERLKEITRIATRFMDNVIEMNPYPLEVIRKRSLSLRRIGLGVGGWADLLIELGIAYDSDEALKLGEKIMKVVRQEAVETSQQLAKERKPFPLWPISIYKDEKPRRNSTVTTIAPTGSISIIAGASSGIEPLFAIAYQHIVKDKSLDRTLTFVNPKFETVAKERGFWSNELRDKVAQHGVVREIAEVPEDVRQVFGTAHEIAFDWHIKHQAAFQKHTENAVSKTINMISSASIDDVKQAYLLSWETGCKGVTIFRDGCKETQVLNLGVNNVKKEEKEIKPEPVQEWTRPVAITGSTYKIKTPVGTAFITVNQDEYKNPVEIFINIGRAGSDVQAMAEALGRLISKSLRFGGNLTTKERAMVIIDQLKGIGGRRSVGFGASKILSLPDAVAVALSTHLGIRFNGNGYNHEENSNNIVNGVSYLNGAAKVHLDHNQVDAPAVSVQTSLLGSDPAGVSTRESAGDICPSCGAGTFVYEEGCSKCYSCAYSEC